MYRNRHSHNHSHPLELVGRLLLDEADSLQHVGDVIDSAPAGLQHGGDVPEVHGAVRRRQQQLQETLRQHPQRHIWIATRKTQLQLEDELTQRRNKRE